MEPEDQDFIELLRYLGVPEEQHEAAIKISQESRKLAELLVLCENIRKWSNDQWRWSRESKVTTGTTGTGALSDG